MTDKAGYHQAAFGGDTVRTVTLTPQEQAAFESGRKIGWNEGIEASAKLVDEAWNFRIASRLPDAIRALSMPAPAPAQAWEPPADRKEGYRCLVVVEMEWQRRFDGSLGWAVPDEHWGRCIESYARSFAPLPAALIPDTEGGA